jgi:predicted dehydrogenase
MKNVICIGNWGHWPEVFQCLEKRTDTRIIGIAPAYIGEDLSTIRSHPLTQNTPIFDTLEDLLKKTDADFAIISSRPGSIANAVISAANAGLDIISEKPLGITFPENEAIQAAIHKNQVRLIAIFSMRALPAFQTARRLVQSGVIGRPVLINARKSYKYGNEANRPEWFGQREEYGGTFPWIGIHALDMIHFTTGLLPLQVAALQRNQAHKSRPDCEDACCGIFQLQNEAQATVSIDYFRPESAKTHGDDWVRIVGTEGIIEANASQGIVQLLKNGSTQETVRTDPAKSLFDPFFDGKDGLTTTRDALNLTHAALCARHAADENRTITITHC